VSFMPPTEEALKKVKKKVEEIWEKERRPFSYKDFSEYTHSYFRKIVSILRRKEGRYLLVWDKDTATILYPDFKGHTCMRGVA